VFSLASEYLQWKYRDVQPDAPVQLTKKEKLQNWWHYHKWHLVIGIVLLAIAVDVGKDALGIGKVTPDYQIAYVGTTVLPEDTVTALENALAQLGEDCNGDGQVIVQFNQYAKTSDDDDEGMDNGDTAYYAYASEVTLMADLEDCESYFFLLDDPEQFQSDYQVLSQEDGSLSENTLLKGNAYSLLWTDCPVLTQLELGDYSELVADQEVSGSNQEVLSHLYLARRGFWGDNTTDNLEGCEALWSALTKGAVSE
jgi:hypothetical protein